MHVHSKKDENFFANVRGISSSYNVAFSFISEENQRGHLFIYKITKSTPGVFYTKGYIVPIPLLTIINKIWSFIKHSNK